ncbi:MAG: cytochrome c peroxidase [Planctomycetota bacterium]
MILSCALFLAMVPQGLPPVFVPPENPGTPEKVLLGKALFWDEQVSSTNTVACGTCHIPSGGGGDPRSALEPLNSTNPGPDGLFGSADDRIGSRGVPWRLADGRYVYDIDFALAERVTRRKAPSMIGAAYHTELFWDGRASSTFRDPVTDQVVSYFDAALEAQALAPILSPVEMGHAGRTLADVVSKLQAIEPLRLAESVPADLAQFVDGKTYPELFDLAFPSSSTSFGPVEIAQALASYQRTLIADDTPYDRWLAGDSGAFTGPEKRGHTVFQTEGQCAICHMEPFTSDFQYHAIGVRPPAEDGGRQEVTGSFGDRGLFKTPGLRNLALRGRYFHDGSAESVEEVIDFYVRGGDFAENQSPNLTPLNLNHAEASDLLAFLSTGLLDPRVADELPPFDRPRLFRESRTRTPRPFAFGTAGAAGEVPAITAIEPAFRGNPTFALGLQHGAAFLPSFLAVDVTRDPGLGTVLFGATVHLGLGPATTVTPTGALASDGRGGGWLSIVCPIPDSSALTGASLFAQWFVLDSSAPGGLAASAGLEVPVF